ncbi:hypothetical protein, partial [Desulfovibrio sp.]|uniref:hypothetical protein n=1 Tax=Desulfovibrio sp. TaxID=885 RepID=UPI0025C2D8D1
MQVKTQLFAATPRPHIAARKGAPAYPHRCMGALLLCLCVLLLAHPAQGMSWSWSPIGQGGAVSAACA